MGEHVSIKEICEICTFDLVLDGDEFDCPLCLKSLHKNCAKEHIVKHAVQENLAMRESYISQSANQVSLHESQVAYRLPLNWKSTFKQMTNNNNNNSDFNTNTSAHTSLNQPSLQQIYNLQMRTANSVDELKVEMKNDFRQLKFECEEMKREMNIECLLTRPHINALTPCALPTCCFGSHR